MTECRGAACYAQGILYQSLVKLAFKLFHFVMLIMCTDVSAKCKFIFYELTDITINTAGSFAIAHLFVSILIRGQSSQFF